MRPEPCVLGSGRSRILGGRCLVRRLPGRGGGLICGLAVAAGAPGVAGIANAGSVSYWAPAGLDGSAMNTRYVMPPMTMRMVVMLSATEVSSRPRAKEATPSAEPDVSCEIAVSSVNVMMMLPMARAAYGI